MAGLASLFAIIILVMIVSAIVVLDMINEDR